MMSQEETSMNEAVDVKSSSEAGNDSLPACQELESIRTHITETQYSDLEPLQANELSESQRDTVIEPLLNGSEHARTTFNKPGHARFGMPSQSPGTASTRAPRYVGRVNVSEVEPPMFSFAQAPKPTADYGRRIKPNNVHMSGHVEVSSAALEALSNHPIVDRHTNLPQPKLPEGFSEPVVSQQISSITKELPNHDLDAKIPEQKILYSNENGSKAQQKNSIDGSVHKEIIKTIVCSEVQEIEDRVHNIFPLPQASSEMLPSRRTQIPDCDQGVRGQDLLGDQTEKPPLPAIACLVATRSHPVKPDALKGISDNKPKVVKHRRKPRNSRPLHDQDTPAKRPLSESMPTEEDLLQILLYRNQQEKKSRDVAKAVQQAREAELQNIKQAYELLRSQMEDVSKREKTQQAELAKYEKVLPGWKIKARKLEDYLKGLTNDHHTLRDDAQAIQRQQFLLQTDKANIVTDVKEACSAIGLHTTGSTKILSETRHHIDLLNQRHDAQALRAQEVAKLLEAEQERNQRLEQEVSKISLNQQRMTELLHTQRLELMEKLNEILTTSSAVVVSKPSDDQACTRNMLDQCIKVLQEFKTTEHVEPDHVERLDASIKGYAEHLNTGLQRLAETSQSACHKQLKLNGQIQKQLDVLKTCIKTEQGLSEQILDLREIKATMKERMHASETSLAEARQTIIGLQGKQQHLNTEISTLRAETRLLQARPIHDPATIDHVRKIESRNTDLETTLVRKDEELSEREHQVQRLDEEAIAKQKLIDGLISQIDEAKVAIRVLEKQKAGCEKQADIKYEGLKSQLLEAANAERSILTNANSIKMEKLQRQKNTADTRAAKMEEEVGRLRAGKDTESKRHGELQKELGSLNVQIQSKNQELREFEEKFRTTKENLLAQIQKSKDERLRLDRHIVETDILLAANISESQSKNEENLLRINVACRAYNNQADTQIDIDNGIDFLIRMLMQAKEPPRTPALDEPSSQGATQQPVPSGGLRKESIVVCKEGPNGLLHDGSTLTSQRRRDGPTDTFVTHRSRDEVVFQESQSQETTICRNLTTTRFRGNHEGNSRSSLRTPTHRLEDLLKSPLLASIARTHNQSILSSPHWSSAELLPPTPIPSLKGPTNRNQLALKSQRRPMSSIDTATTGVEAQSTRALYDGKPHQPSVPPRKFKRSAADFGMTPRVAPAKRRTSGIETMGLGPIIPDSQSPSKIPANNKGRKSRRQVSLDKYAVRFHEVR
ncbi:hypothetical protein MMC18_005747 [Xylographa bjoerkii]|nr:hypothetical protein [Xylographa bjoerkii]